MSIEMYGPNDDWIGECGIAGWATAARMLPGLVEAVNIRCVSTDLPFGHHPIFEHQLPHPPLGDPFSLDTLVEDRSGMSEVRFLDLSELNRFLDWCQYLIDRDVDYIGFYGPLVEWLIDRMHRLDR